MEKYNGWSNRETWLINLWFGDDNPSVEMVKDWFQEAYDKLPDFMQDFVYEDSIDWEELEEAWEDEDDE